MHLSLVTHQAEPASWEGLGSTTIDLEFDYG